MTATPRRVVRRLLARTHVHADRGLYARARHRRQHGHLQRRPRRPAQAAAVRRPRHARRRVAHGAGARHPDPEHVACHLPDLPRGGTGLPGRRALERRRRLGHRQRRARARAGHVRDRRHAESPARQPDPRAGLHRGRRLAEDTRARPPEPRLLATQVRQRPGGRRQVGRRRRQAARDHRRASGRLPLPRSEPAAGPSVPLQPRRASRRQLQLSRCRAPEARHDARAGERRRRASDPGASRIGSRCRPASRERCSTT